jgi:hypothetical protein
VTTSEVLLKYGSHVLICHVPISWIDAVRHEPTDLSYPRPIDVCTLRTNLEIPLAVPCPEVERPAIGKSSGCLNRACSTEALDREGVTHGGQSRVRTAA